jgi:hypothetical protein
MKTQREQMHLLECEHCQPPYGIHRHLGENAVAPLGEEPHQNARPAIGERHHDRRGERPSEPIVRRYRRSAATGKRVSRPFKSEWHGNGGELGNEKKHGRENYARFEVAPVGRPNVRPKID